MNTQTYHFKGEVFKCNYDTPNYKIYCVNVDKQAYPQIKNNKYQNVSIVGDLPSLSIGTEYDITGVEQINQYGVSYKVINIKRNIPTTKEDTYNFLREILTSNQAKTIIESYPDIIERVKNNNLDDIDYSKLKGIGAKTFAIIKNKIISNFCLMDLVTEFKGVLSLSIIKRIYEKYPSVERLKEYLIKEPYTTLTQVSRIGYKTADVIILKLQDEKVINFGYDVRVSADRCLAYILYALEENENSGHTKMNLADLRSECFKNIPECANHFEYVIKNSKDIYYDKETMDISLTKTYMTEVSIAKTITKYLNSTNNKWNFETEKYRQVNEYQLSDEQMQILKTICENNIVILNGSAGVGKSMSVLSVINMLKENNKSFKLFTPTGKSSKVLSDYTNETSSTIHRGLGYKPQSDNPWTFNKNNKLETDIIIVDEFSMVDINLFSHLLDAIDFEETKLLLIGDASQLPSVGCGNLLHDFLQSKIIPTVTLTKVFRYGEGGLMKIATDVRCCNPYLKKTMKSNITTFGNNKDYTFIDLATDQIPQYAVSLYKKILDKGYNIEDIQVLTAKNVGNCGATVLNNLIQKVANPNYNNGLCMKIGDVTYYKGDLVIQKVNNYQAPLADNMDNQSPFENCENIDYLSFSDENSSLYSNDYENTAFVANGESGIIKEITDTYAIIDFDGVCVKYNKADMMTMIGLGYAITTHKSQGSGFKIVILLSPQSDIFMMNSNLLYVGLTRMKSQCYHLGTLASVNQAVKKKANLTRYTFMQDLLVKFYNNCNK